MPRPYPGDLGTPEHLTHLYERVARLERRPTGGGFDPNENPVIIGAGATAGGGSTPDDVSAGAVGSVAIGVGATTGTDTFASIAIGKNSEAAFAGNIAIGESCTIRTTSTYGTDCIAIGHGVLAGGTGKDVSQSVVVGYGATMTAPNSVAVGEGTNVSDYSAVAIGSDASASAHDAVALGHLANAGYINSTAIGERAATDRTNQVMLGRSSQVVDIPNVFAMTDQNDGLRYEVSLNAGAFVFTQVS